MLRIGFKTHYVPWYNDFYSPSRVNLCREAFRAGNSNDHTFADFHSHEKSVLFCISGFGCSDYNFEYLTPHLVSDSRRVILFNPRGFGGSDQAVCTYSLMDLANDVLNSIEFLKLQNVHLIGISMGGFIAQLAILKHLESKILNKFNLKSLSLLCSTSGGSEFPKLPELSMETLEKMHKLSPLERARASSLNLVHPSIFERDQSIFDQIIQLRAKHDVSWDQTRLQKIAVDKFLLEETAVEKITIPTLILAAENDQFVSSEHAIQLNNKIKNSTFKTIPRTNHLFFLEKPTQVANELNEFIEYENQKLSGSNLDAQNFA